MYPRNTRNTRKEIHVCAIPRRLEIQQEITEKTDDRSNLRSPRPPRRTSDLTNSCRRTSKLTDRHKLTYESQRLQGKSPGANGRSVQRLVRHSDHSISKISGLLCPKLP